ncbi:helix-turn-helix transcriptional regulator [Natrinema amylolyticum]|uniref:helix-turn-helix transcriptional regulator n=1 Tax=Natrinema amylolyticum TaxID=2878679 RepID=UPI001CFAAC98|nr:ArsR family transcriptional regulator [Natrinema amylolyticum]
MSENRIPEATTRGCSESTSEAIEEAAFLARSKHRVRVLELLADGARTREELTAGTDVTRVTLSRTLSDLTDRGWIERDHADGEYAITNAGREVSVHFDRLLETIAVEQRYPDVIDALPTAWFDFDLRYLADGELVAGDEADPMSAAVANAVRNASSRKALLGTFLSLSLHTFEEALRVGDEPDGAVVFDLDVAETMLTDANLLNRWQTIESIADSPVYYRIDERVPCGIALIDGTVFLTVNGDQGKDFDVIRCTHPEVRAVDRTISDFI